MDEDTGTGLGSNPGLPLTSSETLGQFLSFSWLQYLCKMGIKRESPRPRHGGLVGTGRVAMGSGSLGGLLLLPCICPAPSPLSRTSSRERNDQSHFTGVQTEAQNMASLLPSPTASSARASPHCLLAA